MQKERFEPPSDSEVKEQTNKAKKITLKILKDFLNGMGFDENKVKCPACGNTAFTVPVINEDNDGIRYPLVVTMPIPYQQGKGIWSYPIICDKCSNTLFFNTGYIVTLLEKEGKL